MLKSNEVVRDMQFTVPPEERADGIENRYFGDPARNDVGESALSERTSGRTFANTDVQFYIEAYEDSRDALVAQMSPEALADFLEAEARQEQMFADLARHSEINAGVNAVLRANARNLLTASRQVRRGHLTADYPDLRSHLSTVLPKTQETL